MPTRSSPKTRSRSSIRHFADPLVGAVAGNVKVGNRVNPLTYWQSIEYVTSQNLDRRAYATINSVTVVPGAVGAWRREAILQAGGYTSDTMAEDMDLTWRIRRIGWRIETESNAIGYTEAPDSFRALFRQRFRWAFGTLQSLWKHRRAMGRYGWFGTVMLPSLWLFQVAFQVLSPLVDLQILWALGGVDSRRACGRLNGDWQPLPNALSSLYLIALHVRLLLRRRADRRAGGVQARSRRSQGPGLALLAALPLPPADVRRDPEVDQDRGLRHPHGMGKARAQRDGGDGRRDADCKCAKRRACCICRLDPAHRIPREPSPAAYASRPSTAAQSTFARNASMYFGRSAGL